MEITEVRTTARHYAKQASRLELLAIINDTSSLLHLLPRHQQSVVMGAARQELVDRYACTDCGAAAGRECKPEYGCTQESRNEMCPCGTPWKQVEQAPF